MMEFIESRSFTKLILGYLDDDEFRRLQTALAGNPEAGDPIPGTGGFRKVRFEDTGKKRGKRGGLRVIYYFFPQENQIWFVTVYRKGEVQDLSETEKKELRNLIKAELTVRQRTRDGKA